MPASLMPVPKIQFFGADGNPLSNGYLYTYANNQPGYFKPTYTDATMNTNNANPVILDTQGRASIWIYGYYTMELWSGEKSLGTSTLIWSQDNVSAIGGS